MTAMTEIRLGPTTDTNTMISSSVGMASTMSVRRIRTWSTTAAEEAREQADGVPIDHVHVHGAESHDERGARTQSRAARGRRDRIVSVPSG